MSIDKSRSAKPARAAGSRERRAPVAVAGSSAMLPKTIGKYAVLGRIGVGAMGVVYKCAQPGLNRPVAIKVLTSSKHNLTDVLPRFQREARAASRLNHPSVVQVYDIGTEGELHYIVMEYVDGWSLDKLIGSPALTVDYTLRLLIHIARALQAAHEAGIVHRDIKPSNILIHRSGQPKLADFGLAKSLHDGPTLSRSGDILGTPRYMSPEQVLMSPKDLDLRTDIYSLGAVMYEMLTGKPPVDGPNVMVMLRSLTDDEPTPVRQRNAGVPESVAAICQKALVKDREKRFASAGQMAEAMQNVLLERFLGSPQPPGGKGTQEAWGEGTMLLSGPKTGLMRRLRARLRIWLRRGLFLALFLGVLIAAGLATGWPARWIEAHWGSGGAAGPAGNAAAIDQLIAQARDHLEGSSNLRASATPRERFQALVDDLTIAVKRSPGKMELYWLRARAYRHSGEYLAAIDDLNTILRQQPDNHAAVFERLLANYQLHTLYLGNCNEAVLRPDSMPQVRDDLDILLQGTHPVRHYAAQLIDALARHSHGAGGHLAEAGLPPETPPEGVPDLAMLQADALYHAAAEALRAEAAAPDDQRAAKRQRREDLVDKAGKALQRGLDADPYHVGLLFLQANSVQRRSDWEIAEGEDRERFLRRHRPAFESVCDRLRNVTLRIGCDTPVGRAVLWNNFDRYDMAIEEVKDAISCRPTFRHLYTFKAWLALRTERDSVLMGEDVGRILRELDPVFETPPDTFNPYFVRAILQAAGGRWWEARADLQQCQRRLGAGRMPSDVPVHNEWFNRASASQTEYLDYTQTLLDGMPIPPGRRIRLCEEVLKLLADPEVLKRDGLDEEAAKVKKGWTNYRLARLYAERKDRGKAYQYAQAALEQKLPNLLPATFKNDGAFADWNNDEMFQKLYAMFEPQQQ
jgi:tetratricopeptide (TPR) repeat protein